MEEYNKQYHFTKQQIEKQKRKHARIDVNIPCTFRLEGQPSKIECTISSLSTGGLGLLAKMAMYPDDKIEIFFKLMGVPITARGAITRTHGKEVGVKFTEIERECVELIMEYIHTKIFKKEK